MQYIFVVSGPSGVGKTTICDLVRKRFNNLKLLVSTTTRQIRDSEVDEIDYNFISKELFEQKILNNKFLEYTKIYNNYYGVEVDEINKILDKNHNVLLNINYQGLASLKNNKLFYDRIVSIFLLPPSIDVLKERITSRGNDNSGLNLRISEIESEMENKIHYDYNIVNQELDHSVNLFYSIIDKYLNL